MSTFRETGLHADIIKSITEMGFETPTPIQEKAIPHLLNTDRDLVALAQTGTGKTAAFGLPAIHKTDLSNKVPQTLILCPTRELCLQITKELTSYSKYVKGLEIVAVYGGANIEPQIRALKKGVHLVVGTPGRTKDLLKRKKLKLDQIKIAILDEADEMLTMGFQEDMEDILGQTPEDKQTLLFSATMSKEIARIASNYMRDAEEITVAAKNVGAKNVEHIYYQVPARERYQTLKRIADLHPDVYGIIFCRTRAETSGLAKRLMDDGYNADALHGDMSQAQRDKVMDAFRDRHLQLLVATDVAARGLDVDDLTHVINYNLPDQAESYTHRSGRTGRAGKSGTSIAIVAGRDKRKIRMIEDSSGIDFKLRKVPTGIEICQRQLQHKAQQIANVEVNEEELKPFFENVLAELEGLSREDIIKKVVFREFHQLLNYYRRHGDVQDEKGSAQKEKQSVRERRKSSEFKRIFINIGKRNHLNPARLMGLINESLQTKEATIGRIDIQNNFSFFEISDDYAIPLIASLDGKNFGSVSLSLEISTAAPRKTKSRFKSKSKSKSFTPGKGRGKGRDRGKKFGKKKKW